MIYAFWGGGIAFRSIRGGLSEHTMLTKEDWFMDQERDRREDSMGETRRNTSPHCMSRGRFGGGRGGGKVDIAPVGRHKGIH